MPWICSGALMIVPMLCRGFRLEYGSWKMIWMSRRSGRSSDRLRCVMSLPSKIDLTAGRLQQAGDHPAERGLAAAGLADDAERLALADVERHPVDGLDRPDLALEEDAPGHREVHLHVPDGQELLGRRGLGLGVGRHLLLDGGRHGHPASSLWPVTGSA